MYIYDRQLTGPDDRRKDQPITLQPSQRTNMNVRTHEELGHVHRTGDCSGWEKDPQSFSKVIAEHYVRTELGLPLIGERIWCSPTGKLCAVSFPGEITVWVSLVKVPSFVIARQAGPDKPRREYNYFCTPEGKVILNLRKQRSRVLRPRKSTSRYVRTHEGLGQAMTALAEATPVEQAKQMSIELGARWDMYRYQKSPGRSWRYFLTDDEYKYYMNQFTFIREKRPEQYANALKALKEYREVEKFFPYYWKLRRAAEDAELALDRKGKLVLSVQRESFLKLLTDATVQAVLDEIGGAVTTFIFGTNIAAIFGLVGQLNQMIQSIINENLLKKKGPAGEEARFKKKLSLFMDVMAQDLAKKYRKDPVKIKLWLWKWYHYFEPIWYRYLEYYHLNQSLAPDFQQQQQPTIRPAP
jgi:hypothetical protein